MVNSFVHFFQIAVHLYLNNPYGLISATIPQYTINEVNLDGKKSESVSPDKKDEVQYVSPTVMEPVGTFKDTNDGANFNKRRKPLPDIHDSKRSSPLSDTGSVFYDKTPRKNYPPNGKSPELVQSCPQLGFTWSINLDKRERAFVPRQPPSKNLLEKLCGPKSVEPVGIIKLKRKMISPNNYLIHRIRLEEKG
jgi:hypothetical protein